MLGQDGEEAFEYGSLVFGKSFWCWGCGHGGVANWHKLNTLLASGAWQVLFILNIVFTIMIISIKQRDRWMVEGSKSKYVVVDTEQREHNYLVP